MTIQADSEVERRLLFLAATRKDALSTAAILKPLGVPVHVCRSSTELRDEIRTGAGAVLLPEEAASADQNAALQALLATEPPWSDLPILILTHPGADSPRVADAIQRLGNVTLLERPVRVATLASAVRTALRARERQYQIRRHLAERARAEAALRRADERKDEFLATLGHELRNPLSPLMAAVHLLNSAGEQEAVVARLRPVMERQVNHLSRLVNDLLEVSRITRGLIDVQRELIDLNLVVQSAIETSRPLIEAAGHQLIVALASESVPIRGDSVRLTQVFANLLNNAAKYTNAGGHVWVEVQTAGPAATVSVRDDGIGIEPDHLSAVFDMFTQVDRSSRRAQGGLGIGLTLVRSLVEMHGGSVEARSRGPGGGSEFTVRLPLASDTVAAPPSPDLLAGFPQRRVLVVDDNIDAANTLADLLRTLGSEVFVAHSGQAALDALGPFAPDAIVVDIGMPEMDGYEVARRIRSTGTGRKLLLIALTGWGQDGDHRQALAAGFDHHLVKPPDLRKLRQALSGIA